MALAGGSGDDEEDDDGVDDEEEDDEGREASDLEGDTGELVRDPVDRAGAGTRADTGLGAEA